MTEKKTKNTSVFLGDIMKIPGEKSRNGEELTHFLSVSFNPTLNWKGSYVLDLVMDNKETYRLMFDQSGQKHVVYVDTMITNQGMHFIMFVRIGNTHCVIKCGKKTLSSGYGSFILDNKETTKLEGETKCYKYIQGNNILNQNCISLLAHGKLQQVSFDGYIEIENEWEAILLQRGSDISLDKFFNMYIRTGSVPIQKIKALTVASFQKLKILHDNDLVHGDAIPSQLIWSSEEDVGSVNMKWIDFERGKYRVDMDHLTWNLKLLMDLNTMFLTNIYSASKFSLPPGFHWGNFNSRYIKENLSNILVSNKWTVNGIHVSNYIIPKAIFVATGTESVLDKYSRDFALKKYFGGNGLLLERLDIKKFEKFLMEENNLFDFLDAFDVLRMKGGTEQWSDSDIFDNETFFKKIYNVHDVRYVQDSNPSATKYAGQPRAYAQQTPISKRFFLMFRDHIICNKDNLLISYEHSGNKITFYVGQHPKDMPLNTTLAATFLQDGVSTPIVENGYYVFYCFDGTKISFFFMINSSEMRLIYELKL